MKKSLLLLFICVVTISTVSAQTLRTISGSVEFSNDTNPAIGVVVMASPADTTSKSRPVVVSTDLNGRFKLQSRDTNLVLTLRYLGYLDFVRAVPVGSTVDMGVLTLIADAERVEAVIVAGQASMSVVKGDTIQFNAAAFKTHPDATAEDLLLKLPGVTADSDGNVQSQGEAISRVFVNGKEFFDGDVSLALKSLPVDAVESVQLFEDKSEDSKFSGFDDGTRIKTVNIVTKKGFMDSMSGRVTAGYGTDGRYATGAQVNRFGDVHSFTLIGQANNVNRRDYNPGDIGAGGRGRGASTTDLSGYTTSSRGGITESYMLGGNYNGDFKTVDVTATYFYGGANSNKWTTREQNYLTMDRNYFQQDTTHGFSNSHNMNVQVEWTPRETDKVTFRSTFSYANNFGTSNSLSDTYLDGGLSNASESYYTTHLERFNGSANLWWSHRFKKAGRTMNIGGNITGNKDDGRRTQLSKYLSLSELSAIDNIDLRGFVTGDGYSYMASGTYSEPITRNSQAQISYKAEYSRSISRNEGLNYDSLSYQYSLIDTATTNYITRGYITQTAGLGYNFIKGEKVRLNARLSYQNSTMDNKQISPMYHNVPMDTSFTFHAFLPTVTLNIKPTTTQNINIQYRSNAGIPSITQLQDILNTTNPLQVSKGNSQLKQSTTNRLTARYNLAIPAKNINLNIYGSANTTSNYIATHRQFLTQDTVINGVTVVEGAQYSEPINLNGFYSAEVYNTLGFGLSPIKSNLNLTLSYRYSNIPSIEDNVRYTSQSNRISGMMSVTSNISEDVDFTLNYSPSVNLTTSSAGRFDRFYSHTLTGKLNVYFFKYLFISSDVTWYNTFGTQSGYTQHYAMLNAAIGSKFFKNRSGEIRFSVYDALNVNQSLWQTTADTYTQITNTQVLSRYYMVSLGFKFDTRSNKGKSNKGEGSRGGYSGGPRQP